MTAETFACHQHFKEWWSSVCRRGDPIRRPNLSEEAFQAGFLAGMSHSLARLTEKSEPHHD